jgi:hypothetical protein
MYIFGFGLVFGLVWCHPRHGGLPQHPLAPSGNRRSPPGQDHFDKTGSKKRPAETLARGHTRIQQQPGHDATRKPGGRKKEKGIEERRVDSAHQYNDNAQDTRNQNREKGLTDTSGLQKENCISNKFSNRFPSGPPKVHSDVDQVPREQAYPPGE